MYWCNIQSRCPECAGFVLLPVIIEVYSLFLSISLRPILDLYTKQIHTRVLTKCYAQCTEGYYSRKTNFGQHQPGVTSDSCNIKKYHCALSLSPTVACEIRQLCHAVWRPLLEFFILSFYSLLHSSVVNRARCKNIPYFCAPN